MTEAKLPRSISTEICNDPARPSIHRRRGRFTLSSRIFFDIRRHGAGFCLIICGLISGCGGGGSDGQMDSVFEDGKFTYSQTLAAPAAAIGGLLKIEVAVNGIPATFILDSGADTYVVSADLARRLSLPEIGTAAVRTVAGNSSAPVVRIESINTANIRITAPTAIVQELTGFDGSLGVPFLRHAVVALRYPAASPAASSADGGSVNADAGQLIFGDPAAVDWTELNSGQAADFGSGGQVLNGDPSSGPSFSETVVEGIPLGAGRIDTGNTGGITSSSAELVQNVSGRSDALPVVLTASNGAVSAAAIIADTVMLDQQNLEDQYVVSITPDPDRGGDNRALIGSLVLQQYSWVFDLPHGVVWLRRDRPLRYQLDQTAFD